MEKEVVVALYRGAGAPEIRTEVQRKSCPEALWTGTEEELPRGTLYYMPRAPEPAQRGRAAGDRQSRARRALSYRVKRPIRL